MEDKRSRRSFAPVKSTNSSRFRRKAVQGEAATEDEAFQVITPFHKDFEEGPFFGSNLEAIAQNRMSKEDGAGPVSSRKESRRLVGLLKGKSFASSNSKMDNLMLDGVNGSDVESYADHNSARLSEDINAMDIHKILRSESVDLTSDTIETEGDVGRGSNVSVKSNNSRGSIFSLLRLRGKSKRWQPGVTTETAQRANEMIKTLGTGPNSNLATQVTGSKRGFAFFANNRVSMDSSENSKGGSFRSGASSWTWGTGSFKGSWRSSKAFGASQESISEHARSSYASAAASASETSSSQGGSMRWKLHRLLSAGSSRRFDLEEGGERNHLKRPISSGTSSQPSLGRGSSGVSLGESLMQKLWRRARNKASAGKQPTNHKSPPASPAHSHDRSSFALPQLPERRFSIDPENISVKAVLGWGGFGNVFLVQVKEDQPCVPELSEERYARQRKSRARKPRKRIIMTKQREPKELVRGGSLTESRCRALKVMQKSDIMAANAMGNISMEINVMKKCSYGGYECPFLVKLHDAFQTPTRLFLLMDYAAGGELFFHLQRDVVFSLPRARLYFLEIALALGHLHSKDIIYRDLKTENVLLDRNGHVKLTDFGLCKHLPVGMKATTLCGTPDYAAPEAVQGEGYGMEADWWALGVLLFEMLVGGAPFSDKNLQIMYQKICYSPMMIPDRLDRDARSMIERLLVRAPQERLGYGRASDGGDIRSIQFHPFVRNHLDVNEVIKRNVVPEFQPNVRGDHDTSNFAEKFTKTPTTMINFRKEMHPSVPIMAPVASLSPSSGLQRMGLGSPLGNASTMSVDATLAEDADLSLQLEHPIGEEDLSRTHENFCNIPGFRWVNEPTFFTQPQGLTIDTSNPLV